MKLLAIECSSRLLSVAAFESGELKRELSEEAPMRQIERLAPLTQELLAQLNWKAAELKAVAVSLGPGSFSGLRTGLAFAKGLCYATGALMLGVSTLEAWAEADVKAEVWLDARRNMIYRWAPGKESRMLPMDEAKAELAAGVAVLGDALDPAARPHAAAIGRLALKRLARVEKDDPAAIEPIYLRRPEAEILWEKSGMGPEGFEFERLAEEDLDEVVEIEKLCFGTPWSRALFSEELGHSDICTWMKLQKQESSQRVAAYMGFWKAVDEAHITNLAVRPEYRRKGLGKALVLEMLAHARSLGCLRATLEVRPSNAAAVSLYESLGFTGVAMRPKYYLDNEEDALIMWKNGL